MTSKNFCFSPPESLFGSSKVPRFARSAGVAAVVAGACLLAAGAASARQPQDPPHKPPAQTKNRTGTTYISGDNFTHRKVVYEVVDGLAVFEGDIILGTVEQAEAWNAEFERAGKVGEKAILRGGSDRRWPLAAVPFVFDDNFPPDRQADFLTAVDHWLDRTRIRFVEGFIGNDYVVVTEVDEGCRSSVGRQGGVQYIFLSPNCSVGNMIHEIGHTVGLWHEQSRSDRGRYVRINWENIEDGRAHNFSQHVSDGDDVGHYDYGSIMHYGRNFFSKNDLPTIEPIDENGHPVAGITIGQRSGLSATDIAAVDGTYFPPFAFYEDNGAGGDFVCGIPGISQEVDFKSDGFSCENDEARSLVLNDLPAGVSLELYDHPSCSRFERDDWVVIRTLEAVESRVISTFESSSSDDEVMVTYHPINGLDGKVSCARVTVCGDDVCEGLESCISCQSDCGTCPIGGPPIGPTGDPCDSLSCAMSCGGPASGTCTSAGECHCF